MSLSEEEAALSDREQEQEVKVFFSLWVDNTELMVKLSGVFHLFHLKDQALANPSCSSDTDNTLHWPDR